MGHSCVVWVGGAGRTWPAPPTGRRDGKTPHPATTEGWPGGPCPPGRPRPPPDAQRLPRTNGQGAAAVTHCPMVQCLLASILLVQVGVSEPAGATITTRLVRSSVDESDYSTPSLRELQ